MNYILHLSGFFERIAKDERITPIHISLYLSLFQVWNGSRFKNPISISRRTMMLTSKIKAKGTYHKVIKELNDFGYIHYIPSYNPYFGSAIHMVNFEQRVVQDAAVCPSNRDTGSFTNLPNEETPPDHLIDDIDTFVEQVPVQKLEPYINTKTINNKPVVVHAHKKSSLTNDLVAIAYENKKSRSRKGSADCVPSSIDEVDRFFKTENSSAIEAKKFFNHFQSNGWKVGGKTPMKDWKAAARKWILNGSQFSNVPSKMNLHASVTKNYSEPL